MGVFVAIKMPALIFLTLLCNGMLNGMLGILLGSGLGFRQSLAAQLLSFSIAALVLGSLAPVTFFMALNAPAADAPNAATAHTNFLVAHTSLIAFAGVVANLHLAKVLIATIPDRRIAATTLAAWLLGNAFVGAQLSWILRPFFGTPSIEIAFLRDHPFDGTFYEVVWRALNEIFHGSGISALTIAAFLLLWLHLPVLKLLFQTIEIPTKEPMNDSEPIQTKPEPTPEALEPNAPVSTVFETLLKSPANLIETIKKVPDPGSLAMKLSLVTMIGFFIFGITLGSFSLGDQLWAAPLKTILGLSFSALICLPSLYIFAALTGTQLRFPEIALGLAGALALIAALLLGFTPVLWVFSQSTNSPAFFGFLVILGWVISLCFGTGFLLKMVTQSGTKEKGPVRVWIGIFLLVTLQMSTTLRPLIGTSDQLFTSEKRFFLEHWTLELSRPGPNPSPEPRIRSGEKVPESNR